MNNKDLTRGKVDQARRHKDGIVKSSEHSSEESRKFRLVIVEPILALFFISFICGNPMIGQYVYSISSEMYNVTQSRPGSDNRSCEDGLTKSAENDQRQAAQAHAAEWMMFASVGEVIMASISTFFLGPYTDRHGRKIAMILPLIGGCLRFGSIFIGMATGKQLIFVVIGMTLDGAFGSSVCIVMACNAYLADITKPQHRILRITITDVTFGLVGATASIPMGYIIKRLGFFQAMLIITFILVIDLFYVVFFVRESLVTKHEDAKKPLNCTQMSKTVSVFTKQKNGRRWKLWCILGTFVLAVIGVETQRSAIFDLFAMNTPLCWDPVYLGYYHGFDSWIKELLDVVIVATLVNKLTEPGLLVMGCLSNMFSLVLVAFATTTWMIFLVPVVGFAGSVPLPLTRGFMSKLVDPHEQGALLAGVGISQKLAGLAGTLVMNPLYAATLHSFKGSVFLLGAALYLIGVTIMIFYIMKHKRLGVPLSPRDLQSDTYRHVPSAEPVITQSEGTSAVV